MTTSWARSRAVQPHHRPLDLGAHRLGAARDVAPWQQPRRQELDRVLGLAKRNGKALAVDGLSFDVLPGRVTGFLAQTDGKPVTGL
jgi:hypothetical protein